MTNQPETETLPSAQLIKKGLLSINPTNNKPFTGITIEHYYNGKNPFDISKIKTRTTFKQGRKNGPIEWFHENGQLWMRENYKNGKKDDPTEMQVSPSVFFSQTDDDIPFWKR